MNKQRYLAELRRLLVFMTDEDIEETLRRYTAMFEDVGPEGEAELIEALGSPTKAAIGLSRGYEPGTVVVETPEIRSARPVAAAELDLPVEKPVDPFGDIPEFHLPGLPEDDSGDDDEPPAAAARETEPSPAPDLPKPIAPPRAEPAEAAAPRTTTVRTVPLGLGIPLFIVVLLGLGVPVAALFLAVLLAALAPGAAVLCGAFLVAVGGLWCTGYMADAILLFGLAFVVLAVGLLVLWLGVWVGAKLIGAYGKGARWIAGELLGRKVTVDA